MSMTNGSVTRFGKPGDADSGLEETDYFRMSRESPQSAMRISDWHCKADLRHRASAGKIFAWV